MSRIRLSFMTLGVVIALLLSGQTAIATAAPRVPTITVHAYQPTNSGRICADHYNYYMEYHVCGKVYATGLHVNQVTFQVDAETTPGWCGVVEALVAFHHYLKPFKSKHGCANTGSTEGYEFTGAIPVNLTFKTSGAIYLFTISDVGRPDYRGRVGFAVRP